MKVSPLSQGSGVPAGEVGGVSTSRTSPDRVAAAKAIAAGETPIRLEKSDSNDPQVERMRANIRKIKMRTQVSTDRDPDLIVDQAAEPTEVQTQSAITDAADTAQPATEETKPLSPQFAALAKQRRALQQERAALEQEKAALATSKDSGIAIDRIKQEPLRVLEEAGVTYDQLTEAILSGQSGTDPRVKALEDKLAALEKGVDQKLTDRDAQAEQQVLGEMRREADKLVADGDEFEMVRITNSAQSAVDLIHRAYKESGDIMDVTEALALIEEQLIDDALKVAQTSKVKQKLTPTDQIREQQQPQDRTMRTLTNRDGARPVLSRRARAIAAFHGNKR